MSPVQHRWATWGRRSPERTHRYFNKFCSAHTKAQSKRPKGQMLKGKQHIRNTEIRAELPSLPFRGCWPKHAGRVSQLQPLCLHMYASKNLFFKITNFFSLNSKQDPGCPFNTKKNSLHNHLPGSGRKWTRHCLKWSLWIKDHQVWCYLRTLDPKFIFRNQIILRQVSLHPLAQMRSPCHSLPYMQHSLSYEMFWSFQQINENQTAFFSFWTIALQLVQGHLRF